MTTQTGDWSYRKTLGISAARCLWLVQAWSVFGNHLMLFTVFSLATFQLHANARELSLIPVALMLPFTVVGPILGVFVDRWNVKRIMIVSDVVWGIIALGLVWADGIEAIYIACFLLGLAGSAFYPAQAIMLRKSVPAAAFLAMNGLMVSTILVSQIVSPVISAWLLRSAGRVTCFILDSCIFLISAVIAMGMSTNNQVPPRKGVVSITQSLRMVGRFIVDNETITLIIGAMTLGLFAINFVGVLLSIYVRDNLRSGVGAFALLDALLGIGMLVGAQMLPFLSCKMGKMQAVVLGLAGLGVAAVMIASIQSLNAVGANMIIAGICLAFITVSAEAILLQEVPEHLLGRVSSTVSSVVCLCQIAAMVLAGPLAQLVGIAAVWYGSGAALIILAAVSLQRMTVSRNTTS
jgi:MFS transporter, DHA3 family, macrolide efflux protein